MRDDLRVEKARDGQDAAGQPDESDGDPGDAFAHPRSQRMNNGNVPVGERINHMIKSWLLSNELQFTF